MPRPILATIHTAALTSNLTRARLAAPDAKVWAIVKANAYGFEARDLELCSRLGLWHVVHCNEQIDMLAAHKTQSGHRVFLKMNSGMNRLGFKPERFRAAWTRLNALPQVEEISLMTHFSDADTAKGINA